jgi:hypothetical protein
MGIPLLRGRLFDRADDRSDAPAVAIINEALWKLHWPDGADPIGEKLLFAPPNAPAPFSLVREIVGVVRGVKYGLGADIRPRAYTPGSQLPFAAASRFVVIETRGERPETIIPQVRQAVRSVDPDQPIALARTLQDWRVVSVSRERFQTILLGLFGAVALLLGAIGVYGVVSYSVKERTREVGIRMALGADRDSVLGWVLRGALPPVIAGVGFGLVVASALSRLMVDMLFDVEPTDPATFAIVSLVLLAVALIASLAPALRASRLDPVASLRV